MIPNEFVSSTIEDLSHLREAIRDTVSLMGLQPVMSEYGEVAYSPSVSVEDACYRGARECQLAIVILGKRYGSIGDNGKSVTHNELSTLREHKIPTYCLTDRDTLAIKRMYDANKGSLLNTPGIEQAPQLFALIDEAKGHSVNNALIPYASAANAQDMLKKQLAHLFGDLISGAFSPIQSNIKDVLSELVALRSLLMQSNNSSNDQESQKVRISRLIKIIRALLSDQKRTLGYILNYVLKIDDLLIAESIIECDTIEEFFRGVRIKLILIADGDPIAISHDPDSAREAIENAGFSAPDQIVVQGASYQSIDNGSISESSQIFRVGIVQGGFLFADSLSVKYMESEFKLLQDLS